MNTLRLGDTAPDFTQGSTEGPIHFHEWAGDSWVVLFSQDIDVVIVRALPIRRSWRSASPRDSGR